MNKFVVTIVSEENIPVSPLAGVDSVTHYKNELREFMRKNPDHAFALRPEDYFIMVLPITFNANCTGIVCGEDMSIPLTTLIVD